MSTLLPAEDLRAAREQEADDFVRNLQPALDAIKLAVEMTETLRDDFDPGSPEHKALRGMLDELSDMQQRVRDQVNTDADDIAAGTWEPGEHRQPARKYPGMEAAE